MIFLILFTIIPCVLTMNSLSARGHAALWKKHARNDPLPAAMVKAETPHSSPVHAMNKYDSPCSPFLPCANSAEPLVNQVHQDTPKSIQIEAPEQEDESSSASPPLPPPPPAMTCKQSKKSPLYFFKNFFLIDFSGRMP